MLVKVAWLSFCHRRKTLGLIIASLVISLTMLISLNVLQAELKKSFHSSVSSTDLIVGARGGSLNLLLYSIFHIGDSMQPMDWRSYKKLKNNKSVAWSIPITLGDSHRGHRVVGTLNDFFTYYRYGERRSLSLDQGRLFEPVENYSDRIFEVVIGAQVARKLGYIVGDQIVVSHGLSAISFNQHKANPLRVVGILSPTGTPVDQALYMNSQVLELLHDRRSYNEGDKLPNPSQLSSVLLGLESRLSIFSLQKKINEFRGEPLQAILPGVALSELWRLLAVIEKILWAMSALLLCSSLFSMVTVLLASMQERQRELALLRVLGAGFYTLMVLLLFEVVFVVLFSCVLALIGGQLLLSASQSIWVEYLGFPLSGSVFKSNSVLLMLCFCAMALLVAFIPALIASRRSLAAGLSFRH